MIEHDITERTMEASVQDARQLLLDSVQDYHGHPYIAPHSKLFPDPFLWDTAIEAIGLRHTDPQLAASIVETQTIGQWSNGMIPNQVFFRDPLMERWSLASRRSMYAPDRLPTSGITQPPLLAEATWQVGAKLSEKDRASFFAKMLPRLSAAHEYLFDNQMINSGLITLKHPYESGMDNTPPWLATVREHWNAYTQTKVGSREAALARRALFLRRDVKGAPADERMEDEDVVAYGILMTRLRKHRYDMGSIVGDPALPLLEDVGFNAIFARANTRLGNIAEVIGQKLGSQLIDQIDEHHEGIEQLWSEKAQAYLSRDARTGELIPLETIGSLMMLYSGVIQQDRAERLLKVIGDTAKFNAPHGLPSTPLDSPYFNQKCYWQGPDWAFSTFVVADGAEQQGEIDLASEIRRTSLGQTHHEHTDTLTGQGVGTPDFRPAAARFIEFAHQEYPDLDLAA